MTNIFFDLRGIKMSFVLNEEWDKLPTDIQRFSTFACKDIPKEYVYKDRFGITGDKQHGINTIEEVQEWIKAVRRHGYLLSVD